MKQLTLLLKSFRLLNVFSMILLLIGLRYYFWQNFVRNREFYFERTSIEFILLLLTVGLISIGGYLINDIYDVEVDKVNKPEKRLAYSNFIRWLIYVVLNVTALTVSLCIAKHPLTTFILLGTIVLLFLYSYLFQKLPLIGNLIVALLAGLLPVLYYSFDVIKVDYSKTFMLSDHGLILELKLISVIFLYSYLGFGLTLLRELIKDIEDVKGDKNSYYKTFPVLVDIKGSQILFYVLVFLFINGLLYLNLFKINYFLLDAIYYYFLTFVFLFISVYQVYKSNFSKASLFLKLTLFSGVLILFIL